MYITISIHHRQNHHYHHLCQDVTPTSHHYLIHHHRLPAPTTISTIIISSASTTTAPSSPWQPPSSPSNHLHPFHNHCHHGQLHTSSSTQDSERNVALEIFFTCTKFSLPFLAFIYIQAWKCTFQWLIPFSFVILRVQMWIFFLKRHFLTPYP